MSKTGSNIDDKDASEIETEQTQATNAENQKIKIESEQTEPQDPSNTQALNSGAIFIAENTDPNEEVLKLKAKITCKSETVEISGKFLLNDWFVYVYEI